MTATTATAHLRIVAPGALTTVQDLGRTGWRRLGVPGAGALDAALLRIANRLVGNADDAPALEFMVAGPTVEALAAPLRVALAGDVAATLTRGARTASQISAQTTPQTTPLAPWRSVVLQPGDTLQVGALRGGRVGCLAVAGLAVAPVLGSASTYLRARLGGFDGRPLAAGDRLPAAAAGACPERWLAPPPAAVDAPIRVVPGPQDDHFDAAAMARFLGSEYRVSPDADRMGLRLQGPALAHRADKGAEIVSDAVVPGSVQVPGNGLPIVLLADGQTVGGYPKIATVVSADLARLAQTAVGAAVRFAAVDVAAAEALAREREAAVQRWLGAIAPLPPDGGVDLAALYGTNLISAMIDALQPP